MDHIQEQESCSPDVYSIHHFLRNICSPILAELLVKELKNSEYMKGALSKDRRGCMCKTLYEILRSVSSKGKKIGAKKSKQAIEKSDGASKTQHINNLADNATLLSQVYVWQFVEGGEENEEGRAVKTLEELDSTLLLNILTNEVLDLRLSDIEKDLNTLKEIRNSIVHEDRCSTCDVHKEMWKAVESIYRYLGKDIATLQEKMKSYFSSPQNSMCPFMEELQQEIYCTYRSFGIQHHNYNMQPTITHLRRDSQLNEIVEDLKMFLKDHRASENQEPRPILLCGAPGAGKTSILHNLVHDFIHTEDFLLVVLMDKCESSNRTKESFWADVYQYLLNFSPYTVKKYGCEKLLEVLQNYSSRFLFLWDLNLQDTRNRPPHMDRGTWVLTYQGVPENSTNCCVLKMLSLSEKQVRQVLWSINTSENRSKEHYNQVLECYRKCEYKAFLNTPDMVCIFYSVCLGMTECVPFYRLIQMYIEKKIGRIEENQEEFTKLGQKAFDAVRTSRKYYPENCLADIQSNICHPFLEYSQSKGYFFQYQVVEDYIAAWYIAKEPKRACALWLKQATLFKRVFEIVCALWCDRENGIHNNLKFVRKYLETLFEITKAPQNRRKKHRHKQTMDVDMSKCDNGRAKKMENNEAMEVDGYNIRAEDQKHQWTMETDDNDDSKESKQKYKQTVDTDAHKHGKKHKNEQAMKVEKDKDEEDDDDTKQNSFVRWVFFSRIAKEHQNNEDILNLLAEILTRKQIWVFKCKLVSEAMIDNISLVLRHINLTQTLTIKLESGPNVTTLSKLWSMLCSHQEICVKTTTVWLVIHHTEKNWLMHEKQLVKLPSIIVKTQAPLNIKRYTGPLLCSRTPHFLKCLCMANLEVLDVYVYDLATLREVLAHQQQSLISVTVRLNLKVEEQKIPNAMQVQLSPLPLTLKITYFKDLQGLLDAFEPPDLLYSLTIYGVYIHEEFKLDLTRFTKMSFLFIRFVYKGRLPPISLEITESADTMELSNEDETKITMLPLEYWTFHLVLNLHLPTNLERFLMRNLSFCDDSKASLLYRYWDGLPFQRLVLLDTNLSLSQFRSSLNTGIEDIRKSMDKKFRLDVSLGSSVSVVKHDRLKEKERYKRRKNKPEGRELIITSETELCTKCHYLSCTCVDIGINNNRDTYQDLAFLAKEVYFSKLLSVSYNGRGVVVRKDVCGDLQVRCPLPFLDDERAQHPQAKPELDLMLEVLALAQIICLSHTNLSHTGATYVIDHLKERKKNVGTLEPFRLTILSCYYHTNSVTQTEVQHSSFTKDIKDEDYVQQFNFQCDCLRKCHIFKKSIQGKIYFNNVEF